MSDQFQLNPRDRKNNEIMLEPRSGRAVPVRAYSKSESSAGEPDDLATLIQYLRIFWKHKWVLLFAMTLGALGGLSYVLRMTPLYSATTTIEIQKPPETFIKPMVQENSTDTQIQLLLSSATRKKAVKNLLAKSIEVKDTKIEGRLATIRNLLKLKDPAKTTRWEDAVRYASSFLTITQIKDSEILSIQTFSPNPQAAQEFADTIAQQFIQDIQDKRIDSYKNTTSWMKQTQQELKARLENSQQQLAKFATSHGLMFSPNGQSGAQSVLEDKLKQIQQALSSRTVDRIKLQADTQATHALTPEVLRTLQDSETNYQTKLVDLEREKARLLVNLTPQNSQVQEIDVQIARLEKARDAERANNDVKSQTAMNTAVLSEAQLEKEFDDTSKKLASQSDDVIKYNLLQSEIDTNKKLYDAMQEQGNEASIASAMHTSGARVVDYAGIANSPAQPDLNFYLTLGMLGGLCCGAAFVVVRSRADLTIQSPGVMEAEFNIRELGVIPSARTDREARMLRAFSAALPATAGGSRRMLDSVDCLEMVTRSEKPSVMAEAFRATMTSILFSDGHGDRPKVLVFTSASPGEGKSTVISNLAISLAQINQRVLLIDADMRLPRAHAIFDVPNNFGLSDILHERVPVHEYSEESLVRKTQIPNLFLLPAGPARTHLSRLFHSTRMQDLLMRFRDSFDIVLIDTAPVLIVPDSRILARAADGVVLVVRAHRTHQEAAFAAASRFASDGTHMLGTILNDWNPSMSTQTYGGYYGHNGHYTEE